MLSHGPSCCHGLDLLGRVGQDSRTDDVRTPCISWSLCICPNYGIVLRTKSPKKKDGRVEGLGYDIS